MGDLLVQALQQLFPHQLGADLPLRLVGDHIVREEMGALHGVFFHLVHQLLQPLAGFGGDGDDGVKIEGLSVQGHDGKKPGLVHGIDLVDDQDGRGAGGFQALDQFLLLGADGGHRLHQQQHRVHIRHALLHHVHHVVPQPGTGLVKARGVHQHKLGVPPADNGGDAVAGGLGLIGYDGDLFAHKGVGQSGFSHIGSAADGNHGGFGVCHISLYLP